MSKRIVLTVQCPEHMYDWHDALSFAQAAAEAIEKYASDLSDVHVVAVDVTSVDDSPEVQS